MSRTHSLSLCLFTRARTWRAVRRGASHATAIVVAIQLVACGEAPVAAAPRSLTPSAASRSLSLGPSVDLGSLGGGSTIALAISSTGFVAGGSRTSGGAFHAFIWTQSAGMRDLGTLPGGTYSQANAVNASGQIVGIADGNAGPGVTRAFLWTAADGMKDLGMLPGGITSSAWGINDAGQAVGFSSTTSGIHAFLWTASNGLKPIDPPGFAYSTAWAINNRGMIVGYGTANSGSSSTDAFVWTAERGIRMLPGLGGDNSSAFAINDAGVIGGSSNLAPHGNEYHAVLWTNGVARDLGNLGGMSAQTFAVGPNGEAFGDYYGADLQQHGFRWTPTFGMEDITAATGITAVWGVNRELFVVGSQYMTKIRRVGY